MLVSARASEGTDNRIVHIFGGLSFSRVEADIQLEYEVLKCLRHILNVDVRTFMR
jgi:hypothetical protein